MVLETLMKLVMRSLCFWKKTFFAPKVEEMGQNWGFEFKEKFGH